MVVEVAGPQRHHQVPQTNQRWRHVPEYTDNNMAAEHRHGGFTSCLWKKHIRGKRWRWRAAINDNNIFKLVFCSLLFHSPGWPSRCPWTDTSGTSRWNRTSSRSCPCSQSAHYQESAEGRVDWGRHKQTTAKMNLFGSEPLRVRGDRRSEVTGGAGETITPQRITWPTV